MVETTRDLLRLGASIAIAASCAACSSGDDVAPGVATAGEPSGGTPDPSGSSGGLDGPPTIRVLDAHPVLTETSAQVLVVLSHAHTETIHVDFTTADGSATAAAGDYETLTTTLELPPGTTHVPVAVKVETPYKALTLDGTLNRAFATKLSNPTAGATIERAEGEVTLAHAGMVIETPLAVGLVDGDIAPDFNGDGGSDLLLSGHGGRACVLLTPATVFEEAAHLVVDQALLDGEHGFSYAVDTAGLSLSAGLVAGDQSMAADHDGDGLTDLLVFGEAKAHLIFGHEGPFFEFESHDPRLSDGAFGTELADVQFGWGSASMQVGDYDGDGVLDFGQAHYYSNIGGGSDRFQGFYGSVPYPGTYTAASTFAIASGTTPVGQASLSNGASSGARADLNGDGKEDLVFVGIAANDGQFGGNYLYVRFNDGTKLVDQGSSLAGKLDGATGFSVSNAAYLSNWSSFVPQDAGDVNGDGIQDLVVLGGGVRLSVIFGKKAPYSDGAYTDLADMGADIALFDTDEVASARIGDLNRDGIGDIVFVSGGKLRVVWGQQGLTGKAIFGTQYPEVGELDIDPASGLDDVAVVGDIDGDDTFDIVLLSDTWNSGTGGALILFGDTLTRLLGGPDLDLPEPK